MKVVALCGEPEAWRAAGESVDVSVYALNRGGSSEKIGRIPLDILWIDARQGSPHLFDVESLASRVSWLLGGQRLEAPRFVGLLTNPDAVRIRTRIRSIVRAPVRSTRVLEVSSYGSPVQGSVHLSWFGPQGFPLPPPSTGPGVFDAEGRPKLWPEQAYGEIGAPVHRDDPDVVQAILSSYRGEGTLPVLPGFSFTIPEGPVSVCVTSADGGAYVLSGLLAHSSHRSGGFDLLTVPDLARLLGRPDAATWDDVRSFLPGSFLGMLLGCTSSLSLRDGTPTPA